MRKGEEKRQDILTTAEKLFCSRGYEATSIQDILNVLHMSKGGFYHHFASKEELLKALCALRAERVAAFTEQRLASADAPLARLEALLHAYLPLRRDEASFLIMLLPLIETAEGRSMGMVYQEALRDAFRPLLAQIIADGTATEAFCPPVRDMEDVILHLMDRCWMDVVSALIKTAREGLRYDASVLLSALERYRRAVEVLLDAPYGSLTLVRIEEWDEVAQRILRVLEN